MNVSDLPWWEREKLLTEKDKYAMQRAINSRWEDIDPSWAETPAGEYELKSIISRKRHQAEWIAGML